MYKRFPLNLVPEELDVSVVEVVGAVGALDEVPVDN
jgi:hypothetical protein